MSGDKLVAHFTAYVGGRLREKVTDEQLGRLLFSTIDDALLREIAASFGFTLPEREDHPLAQRYRAMQAEMERHAT